MRQSTSLALIGAHLLIFGCGSGNQSSSPVADPSRQAERDRMVRFNIASSGVKDPAVLEAMRRVPRHMFVPPSYSEMAYDDRALPIEYGQTISQPSLVAYMVESLSLRGDEKVLEIGTGSGYQAAVLAEIVPQVFTIEIIEPLAQRAMETLTSMGYHKIQVRTGDGYRGWPEEAPFDAIILTASPDHVPQPLLDQMAIGGRLIAPLGRFFQRLVLVRRTDEGYERSELLPVMFVPMTGEAEGSGSGQKDRE